LGLEKLSIEDAGILTPFEARVLELVPKYPPAGIAKALHVNVHIIYSVFQRIRDRRRRFQRGVNFFNSLCKDKRFYHFLTPKPEYKEEGIEDAKE
jgi:hypothetical protein